MQMFIRVPACAQEKVRRRHEEIVLADPEHLVYTGTVLRFSKRA